MDALTTLHEHIDMQALLEHYDFDKVKEKGTMIRACCKLHGGSNPSGFVVNTNNNLWYCHTGGCGGGDAFTLVQKLENCTFPEAVHKVADFFGINLDNLEIQERQASYVKEMKKWIKTMRTLTKKKEKNAYHIPEEVRSVTKFRDFLPSTLEHFGLSYVEKIELLSREDKPYQLKNRLVFPVMQEGVQVGVSLRRIKAKDEPKWSHQPVSFETKDILYNYDAIQGEPSFVICEGITDVWAYHEIGVPAVCTFGAHLTEEQYRLLMRTGADLIWSYDGDEAGAFATKNARELFRNKANQYVVHFTDREDPASITREELKERYDKRERTL